MWFRLARVLGMSVKRARREIDSREFAEWLAYWEIEPFGDEWRIAARTMSCMAACMTGKTVNPEKLQPGRKPPKEIEIMDDAAIEAAFLGHLAEEQTPAKPQIIRKKRE